MQGRTAAAAASAGAGAARIAPRAATPGKVCRRSGTRVGAAAAGGSRDRSENKCGCHDNRWYCGCGCCCGCCCGGAIVVEDYIGNVD